jgi:hypothetical protein
MTRMLCSAARALLFGLVLLWAERGGAFEPELSREQRALAQALFERARGLLAAGDAREACRIFDESARIEPALATRFHVGLCHEALGRFASALRAFTEVADLAAARGEVALGDDSRQRARTAARRSSKLRIIGPASAAAGVQIERDGVVLDVTEWGLEVPVDAGVHQVRAYGEGFVEWSEQLEVLPGPGVYTVQVPELAAKRLGARLTLGGSAGEEAQPIDRSFLGPAHRKVAVIAGGIGVIYIGVGSVFVLRAISNSDA